MMPTAKDRNVDVANIGKLENNIHAGTKYLAFLKNRYFSESAISDDDSLFFSLAAYNAGPARITRLQKRAAGEGLDPNRWFGNVEIAALEEIGRETVRYVANIYKYYLAYSSIRDIAEQRSQNVQESYERPRVKPPF